jgi:hypothetical protein
MESSQEETSPKHKLPVLSKEALELLTTAWAELLWIRRGAVINGDKTRSDANWMDGKRMVGFLLAKQLNEYFSEYTNSENTVDDIEIQEHYCEYLNMVSIDGFKLMLAHKIWENNGCVCDNDKRRMEKDYYDACNMFNKALSQLRTHPKKSPEWLSNYFSDRNKVDKTKIAKRKAFWRYMAGYEDATKNNEEAKIYVDNFYDNIIAALDQGHDSVSFDYFDLVEKNTQIANILECYVLHCLKYKC